MLKRFVTAIGLAAALSGCAAQLAQQADAECKSFGAAPGTAAYVDCRLRLKQMQEARAAAIAGAGPVTCQQFGTTTTCF